MLAVTRTCPTCRRTYPDGTSFCGADGSITIQDQEPRDFDARLGTRLGDYVVAARVADGAMGRVFEGRHHATKARVALKVMHPTVLHDRVAVERFRREFESTRELSHPHIVRMLECGQGDGSPFLVMEFLEGEELGKLIGRGKPMAWARAIRLLCQVSLALEHAHSYGFVHRDLKPENIFVCHAAGGDEVRVLDFGSVKFQLETGAKLTAVGTTVGSPFYMSPEQAMGRTDVDPTSDVFALGAIAYEMFSDQVAFHAPNVAKILLRILHDEPVPVTQLRHGLPPPLDAVLAKALAKAKPDRYPSARAFAVALLEAFGLPTDVEAWAARPQSELDAALAASAGGPRAGLEQATVRMQAPAAAALRRQAATEVDADAQAAPTRGRSAYAWIALGVVIVGALWLAFVR